MNNLLIRGLRQRRVHGGDDWRELVTSAIQGEWPTPKPSEPTRKAENGLGIDGAPYYFYILRADGNFSLVVFVLSENEEADWPSDARGATPFDSGGLWLKKITTNPELDDAGRRTFFQDHDRPLTDWQSAFEDYVRTHYGAVSSYLKGNAPSPRTEPPNSPVTIITGSPNSALAWTWEVRVPHDLIAPRLALRAVCMTETRRDDYLDWLWRSPLTDHESLRIHQWMDTYVVIPRPDESVVQAIGNRLALEITNA